MKNDVQNNTNGASANGDKEYHEEVTIVLNGKAEALEEDPGEMVIIIRTGLICFKVRANSVSLIIRISIVLS